MPGIVRYGSYVPFFRLARKAIGAGKGERAVASFDEDAVSMAVEAAREAMRGAPAVDALLFATTSPPYAEKLNGTTIHAALQLPSKVRSVDLGASSRMGLGALLTGLDIAGAGKRALVCAGDVVVGAPGGGRESASGDAAAAFVTGPDSESGAVLIGSASATTEILDVWRLPEDRFAKSWEERFSADMLAPLVADTCARALADAKIAPADLTTVIADAANPRAVANLPKGLKLKPEQSADLLGESVGRSGVAHSLLTLARALDAAKPGDRILVLSLADGCDAAVFEVTSRIAQIRPKHTVDAWIASKRNDVAYNTYLKWRGILPFEPPRRPDPERPAAPPMARGLGWKLGFVGSRCADCGMGQLPPQRVCLKCGAVDHMRDEDFAEKRCKVATYTLDYLAYSLNPPTVAGVIDFEGGGRVTCEVTDVEPSAVKIGDELEMTFRRLYTGQGVHNYFWKARPRR
jgi:3-hydroxy-3-methylglutaryl CoA synthase/uncharacterized OB-fold protein